MIDLFAREEELSKYKVGDKKKDLEKMKDSNLLKYVYNDYNTFKHTLINTFNGDLEDKIKVYNALLDFIMDLKDLQEEFNSGLLKDAEELTNEKR